ncbi:MAG TPA: RluA family pseudouridine synthase [Pyrinomonadaceae bacterium]|jgi:23S rRNA pseudouridine1911/1915/1917 synthase
MNQSLLMKESLRFQIEQRAAGQRLDEFLAERLGQLSRLRIASLLNQGACMVNERAARAGQQVRPGDVVEVLLNERATGAMTPEPLPLEIIYEDEHLLVVVKPAGMLVHPTRGVKSGTLSNALAYHLNREVIEEGNAAQSESQRREPDFPDLQSKDPNLKTNGGGFRVMVRPGIVHRLDRATSGLMVIAKHQRALSILTRHFHHRLVEKRYLALLQGCVVEDERIITAPIGRDECEQPHWRVMESGRDAETRLRVLERRGKLTLVELEPVTGRTNQLRIHCAHIGHAVVGDEWYGAESLSGRLCLHAARLCFHHPSGGEWMEFNAPLPDEIAAVLSAEAPI